MPLQFISMPLPSMQLEPFVAFALLYISAQCLRYAIQGSAKPLRLNTNPCNTLAIQLISIHRHCGPNRLCSNQRLSQSSRILSPPCLCLSFPCPTKPLLFTSWHCVSLPSHYISMLFAALAMLYISSPCLRCSTQVTPLPRNTAASLRVLHSAVAFLCSTKHCAAMAFLCSAYPCVAIAMQR